MLDLSGMSTAKPDEWMQLSLDTGAARTAVPGQASGRTG